MLHFFKDLLYFKQVLFQKSPSAFLKQEIGLCDQTVPRELYTL